MSANNTSILKVRLEGIAVDVELAAKSLKSVLQIVEESRSYAKTDGTGVRRYLVVLVKRDNEARAT